MDYQRHSRAFKEAILQKLSQSQLSRREFAEQEGIKLSTLYSWQKQFNTSGFSESKVSSSDKWSNEEKFAVVLETAVLSEAEFNQYCREKGLYPEQVKQWKQACVAGNTAKAIRNTKLTAEQQSDKKRIKELERELRRKEKALAESAALLVLGKKFDAYWEEKEDS
ncbi:Transposase [Marinomonas spartinae]|uniref:Transposase n=1 Tax=Marinomonas spartinae TaxID=1792290 RepID=A0A1A8TWX7_9GAMM|nr:Transposase [Marinomonas spartinae]